MPHNTREVIEKKQKVLTSTACCRACFRQRKQLTDEIIKELEQTHHQELQKALAEKDKECGQAMKDFMAMCHTAADAKTQKTRHDWLREEIVKLEGMKIEYEHTVSCLTGKSKCSDICRMVSQRLEGANATLQTIIDRYQSELDQPITNEDKK